MHTKTNTRERRAIDAMECPRCHAWPGYPCFHKGVPTWSRQGRLFCHNERRAAWVDWKEKQVLPAADTAVADAAATPKDLKGGN
jgi:hypothetical protein